MKTYKEIINQTPVFLHDFTDRETILAEFHDALWDKNRLKEVLEEYKDVNILFASYGNDNYSGDAWVLFEQGGKLYETEGSHCSCHGLENQWLPEEVVLPELEHRLMKGTFGENYWAGNEFKKELCEFLGVEYKG